MAERNAAPYGWTFGLGLIK